MDAQHLSLSRLMEKELDPEYQRQQRIKQIKTNAVLNGYSIAANVLHGTGRSDEEVVMLARSITNFIIQDLYKSEGIEDESNQAKPS